MDEVIRLLKNAAFQGYAKAHFALGTVHSEDQSGQKRSSGEAMMQWF